MSDHNHKDLSDSESIDSMAVSHDDLDSHHSFEEEDDHYSGEQNDLQAQGKEEVKEAMSEKELAQLLPSTLVEQLAFAESPMPAKEEETKQEEAHPPKAAEPQAVSKPPIIPNISEQPKQALPKSDSMNPPTKKMSRGMALQLQRQVRLSVRKYERVEKRKMQSSTSLPNTFSSMKSDTPKPRPTLRDSTRVQHSLLETSRRMDTFSLWLEQQMALKAFARGAGAEGDSNLENFDDLVTQFSGEESATQKSESLMNQLLSQHKNCLSAYIEEEKKEEEPCRTQTSNVQVLDSGALPKRLKGFDCFDSSLKTQSVFGCQETQDDKRQMSKYFKKKQPLATIVENLEGLVDGEVLDNAEIEAKVEQLESSYQRNEYNCQKSHHHNPKTLKKINSILQGDF